MCFEPEEDDSMYLGYKVQGSRRGIGVIFSKEMEVVEMGKYGSEQQLEGVCSINKNGLMEEFIAKNG
jgi:hypothetical protein